VMSSRAPPAATFAARPPVAAAAAPKPSAKDLPAAAQEYLQRCYAQCVVMVCCAVFVLTVTGVARPRKSPP
jgi:hypothetical protein